jgi:hypothetical protein
VSSDHFEDMNRQSLVEVSPETMTLFAPCSPEVETPKQVHTKPLVEDDPSEYTLHVPADQESEQRAHTHDDSTTVTESLWLTCDCIEWMKILRSDV